MSCILGLLLLFYVFLKGDGQSIDGLLMRDALTSFLNKEGALLGFQDSLAITAETLDENTINAIGEKFKTTLKELEAAVIATQNKVSEIYSTFTRDVEYTKCCKLRLKESKYSEAFRVPIDDSKLCQYADGEEGLRLLYADEKLLKHFQENVANFKQLNIKWQYFASEQGLLFTYPAAMPQNCSREYDPRSRQWYLSAASSSRKDVVIVIDNSVGMSESISNEVKAHQIAKNVAVDLLDSLRPQDRVAVVAFGEAALTAEVCEESPINFAKPFMKTDLSEFLQFLVASGQNSNFSAGIEAALNILYDCDNGPPSCKDDSNLQKVIVFISGMDSSTPTTSHTDIFRLYENRIKEPIDVIVYGIGAVPSTGVPKLESLTDISDVRGSPLTKGSYTHIITDEDRLGKTAEFYQFFSSTLDFKPKVSYPAEDLFGLGTVISITAPVSDEGGFLGVAGIDVTLTDFMGDVLNFNVGERGYSFIWEHNMDFVIGHPLLPLPYAEKVSGINQIVADLQLVELELYNQTNGEFFKSGSSVNKQTLKKNTFFTMGNTFREGVFTLFQAVDVYAKPVQDTSFTVIVVDFKDETQVASAASKGTKFLYHLLIPETHSLDRCKFFFHDTHNGSSVVKFSPQAFLQPETYLSTVENITVVNNYSAIMSREAKNDVFVDGITDDVTATSFLDEKWTTERAPSVVWRYVGTHRGVFRLHPPASLGKQYDPKARPWYKRAALNTSQIVVSSPTLDPFGMGYLCTISKAIVQPGTSKVYAVIGVDVKITYLYEKVQEFYTICGQTGFDCILMDSAGYVVMHSNWVYLTYKAEPTVESVHITQWEKEIADHMHQSGYLSRSICHNIADIREQYYTQVTLPDEEVSHLETDNAWYKITHIPETNLYLILRSTSNTFSIFPQCTCDVNLHHILTPECQLSSIHVCECPCYLPSAPNFCLSARSDPTWQPCPKVQTSSAALTKTRPDKKDVRKMDYCYDPACKSLITHSKCNIEAQCHWCVYDSNGKKLKDAYCAYWDECILGQKRHRTPYAENYGFEYVAPPQPKVGETKEKSELSTVSVAFIIIAVLVLVCVAIGAGVFFYHKYQLTRSHSPTNLAEVLVDLTSQRDKKSKERSASISIGPGGVPYLVIGGVDEDVLEHSHGHGLDVPRGSIMLPRGGLLEGQGGQEKSKHQRGSIMIPLSGVDASALREEAQASAGRNRAQSLGQGHHHAHHRRASAVDDYIIGGHGSHGGRRGSADAHGHGQDGRYTQRGEGMEHHGGKKSSPTGSASPTGSTGSRRLSGGTVPVYMDKEEDKKAAKAVVAEAIRRGSEKFSSSMGFK